MLSFVYKIQNYYHKGCGFYIKNIWTFILGIISFICLILSSVILWYIMIQSTCKMTVVGIILFGVGCIFMHYFSKVTNIKML